MYPTHITNQHIVRGRDDLNFLSSLMQQQNDQLLNNASDWLNYPPENTQLVYENGQLYKLRGDGLQLDYRITDLALRLLKNSLDDPFPLARTQSITRNAIILHDLHHPYNLPLQNTLNLEDKQYLLGDQWDEKFHITHQYPLTVNDLATEIFEQHPRTQVRKHSSHYLNRPQTPATHRARDHQSRTHFDSSRYYDKTPTRIPREDYSRLHPTYSPMPLTGTESDTSYNSHPGPTIRVSPLTVSRYAQHYPSTKPRRSRAHHRHRSSTRTPLSHPTEPQITVSPLSQTESIATTRHRSNTHCHIQSTNRLPYLDGTQARTTSSFPSQIKRGKRSRSEQLHTLVQHYSTSAGSESYASVPEDENRSNLSPNIPGLLVEPLANTNNGIDSEWQATGKTLKSSRKDSTAARSHRQTRHHSPSLFIPGGRGRWRLH